MNASRDPTPSKSGSNSKLTPSRFFLFLPFRIALGFFLAEGIVLLFGIYPWPRVEVTAGSEIVKPDKFLGWSPRAFSGMMTAEKDSPFKLTISESGLRSVPDSSESGSQTVLFMGDSVIWGWGLNDSDTLANVFAKNITDSLVVNGAVPGYGILQSALRYRILKEHFTPQLIVVPLASYLFLRDRADISWTEPLARVSTQNNISLPFGFIRGNSLSIQPARNIFLELPFRNTFGVVRLVEVLTAAVSSAKRKTYSTQIEREVFTLFRSEIPKETKLIALRIFPESLNPELLNHLELLGVKVVECYHPSYGTPQWNIPGDTHPRKEVIGWTAQCLINRLETLNLVMKDYSEVR